MKSIFLNDFLEEEEVYIELTGYIENGYKNKVLRLKKSLYGLKQALRAWNPKIDAYSKTNGFKQCPYEYSLYFKEEDGSMLYICLHVDDQIFTKNNPHIF